MIIWGSTDVKLGLMGCTCIKLGLRGVHISKVIIQVSTSKNRLGTLALDVWALVILLHNHTTSFGNKFLKPFASLTLMRTSSKYLNIFYNRARIFYCVSISKEINILYMPINLLFFRMASFSQNYLFTVVKYSVLLHNRVGTSLKVLPF